MFRMYIALSLVLAAALAAPVPAPVKNGDPQGGQAAGSGVHEEAAPIEPPVAPLNEKFDQAVDEWIRELAKQPEFADWSKASRRREPLGPGLHGWIVILSHGGKEIGYLVVGAKPDGQFMLVEYGSGEYPLFSNNTLYRSLVQHELIPSSMTIELDALPDQLSAERHYFGPFETVWAVTIGGQVIWLDAKTGEVLPLDAGIVRQAAEQADRRFSRDGLQEEDVRGAVIVRSLTASDFDPYEHLGWLSEPNSPLPTLLQLQQELAANRRVTYVTELYGGNVLYALATTGCHEWQSIGTFIRLDHLGARYIAARQLLEEGIFYQIPSPSYS